MAHEKGVSNWLNAYPLKEHGFNLNKQHFWDAISIWYGWPWSNLPTTCACGSKYDFQHSMSCKKGGLVSICHKHVANMLREACNDVEVEAKLILLTGEQYRSANYRRRSEARYSCSKFLGERSRSIFRYKGFRSKR